MPHAPFELAIGHLRATPKVCRICRFRFSFGSGRQPYRGPMLAAKPKTKRHLETIQFILTFVSVCAVVETARIHSAPDDRLGYYSSGPQRSQTERNRSFSDLARSERKRRESELKDALEQR
jgi:hypothetical protein